MAAAPDLHRVCRAGLRLRLKSPVIDSGQLPNSARLFRGPHEHGSNRRASCRITQGSRGPSAAEGRPTVVVGASRRSKMPSRPGEFHPEPLTDPDLNLSIHPARGIARRLPPSAEPSGSSRYHPVGPSSTAMTCPFAPRALPRFVTTTRQSAPLQRIGTFGLAVGAACAFSLGIAGQVLTFRTRARLSFAPPTCRLPLGPPQASPKLIPDAGPAPSFDIA